MMTKKQFLESQKECASMLGMSLSEYQNDCKKVKITPRNSKDIPKYDNSILKKLGLNISDLKVRRNKMKAVIGEIWLVLIPMIS